MQVRRGKLFIGIEHLTEDEINELRKKRKRVPKQINKAHKRGAFAQPLRR